MKFIDHILDFIYPPVCVLCGEEGKHPLCGECLSGLEPKPQTYSLRPFNVLTILPYEGSARELIHKMKFESHDRLATLLAELAIPYLQNLGERILIPVPIHPLRLRKRGFNQSEIIAKKIAKELGWKCKSLLRRTKNTDPQFNTNYEDRAENVKHAFAVTGKVESNKQYMLVDDVVTTTATLQSCAEALFDVGVSRVDTLAITNAIHSPSIIVDSDYFM